MRFPGFLISNLAKSFISFMILFGELSIIRLKKYWMMVKNKRKYRQKLIIEI